MILQTMIRPFWPLLCCLAACLILLSACGKADAEENQETIRSKDDIEAIRQRLSFQELSAAQQVRIGVLPAEIVVPEDATWNLGPGASARIQQWHVRIGDTVEPTQLLAEVSNFEQSDISGQIAQARAAVQQRQAILSSKENAKQFGAATTDEVDAARAAVQEAQAQQRALEQSLRARNTSSNARQWTSPVHGVVSSILCAPGAVVDATTHCITLLDTQNNTLRAYIPEALAQRVDASTQGQWYAWGNDDVHSDWVVARRSPTIDAFSRTQTIDFINETATTLLPGQSGRLELFAPAENTWFDVPRRALTVLDDQNVLFVDLPDHDLPEPAPVTIIAQQHDRVIISAPDLKAGTRFVDRGAFLLKSLAIAELGGGHDH